MKIKISSIKINPGRREAEPKAIEELARSIAAVGLMNPITVTPARLAVITMFFCLLVN